MPVSSHPAKASVDPRFPTTPQAQMIKATTVAGTAARMATAGIRQPRMAMLVNVANMPPAGVKPPYMKD